MIFYKTNVQSEHQTQHTTDTAPGATACSWVSTYACCSSGVLHEVPVSKGTESNWGTPCSLVVACWGIFRLVMGMLTCKQFCESSSFYALGSLTNTHNPLKKSLKLKWQTTQGARPSCYLCNLFTIADTPATQPVPRHWQVQVQYT